MSKQPKQQPHRPRPVPAAASTSSNLRALTPTKPIRETYTLIPGVKVTVVASPDKWPRIKKDGAYVSIDAAPAEANATRDKVEQPLRRGSGSSGSRTTSAQSQLQDDGDHTIPGATVTESLPGDDDVADAMAASMDLTPESMKFLKSAERSIMRKEEL